MSDRVRLDLLDRISRLSTWRRGDEQAPHKPLLLLILLARIQHGDYGPVPFAAIEDRLRSLLMEFGPSRKSYHPEYPFWHLRSAEIWKVQSPSPLVMRVGHNAPGIQELRRPGVVGELAPEIVEALRRDPQLLREIANKILEGHFPATLHQDIATSVGLELQAAAAAPSARDPAFRELVLRAYEYRCAVCGFAAQLDGRTLALEAAHVQWQARGGPCVVENGIALCPLHHTLLDHGIWSLGPDREIVISARASGQAIDGQLLAFHGRKLNGPQTGMNPVAAPHIKWHQEWVFKGPGRAA